ncbi:hypothetical protein DFH28DRAFT_346337 [Melampsora americana]|nr:hypothetical protein DFH28DRAFT_346337 [Melampsora americana]
MWTNQDQKPIHYSPMNVNLHHFHSINPSLKKPTVPTPIKLSQTDAKVWATDLLNSLSYQKDPSPLQPGLKSGHTTNLGRSSMEFQLDKAKENLMVPTLGASSAKHLPDYNLSTKNDGSAGRHQKFMILNSNWNIPLYSLQERSIKEKLNKKEGLKRKQMIKYDERKITKTHENNQDSELVNLNHQEDFFIGIDDLILKDFKPSSPKGILRPNLQVFKKRISSIELSLFDFQSDESDYESSMSVILKKNSIFLPIEDQFLYHFENQFLHQKETFQQIYDYCQWIKNDLVYRPPKISSNFYDNWYQYSLSSLYHFGTFKIHSNKFAPLREGFDDVAFSIDNAYDRLRWVRQVQSMYKIPNSRKMLCEAIMWGGYILFHKKRCITVVRRTISRFVEAWQQHHKKMSELGPISPTYVARCMIHIASMTEETWMDSNVLRMRINRLHKERSQNDNGNLFWKKIMSSKVFKSEKILNWGKIS